MNAISLRKRINFHTIFTTNLDGSFSPTRTIMIAGLILDTSTRLVCGHKIGWLEISIHAGLDLDVAYHFGGTYELIGLYPEIQEKNPALMKSQRGNDTN